LSDDIENKLKELEKLREQLRAQLAETSAVLGEVERSINSIDIEPSQVSPPTVEAAIISADALLKRTEENLKMRLIPDNLTMEQISVVPGERIVDRRYAFSEMIDASQAAVVIKDGTGKFLYANRTVHAFFDLPMGTMVGTTDKNWSLVEEANTYRANDELVIRSGQTLDLLEKSTSTSGETTYWYAHRFALQGNKTGTLVGIIALDVTDIVNQSGPKRATEVAGARIKNMEILKQQLIRFANQAGLV
jgi:PAS domain-containing protein